MYTSQAFRLTNNNDLTSTVVAPGGITLPDVLTESDLFTNLDTSLLFPQNLNLESSGGKRPSELDFGSQFLPDSTFRRSVSQEPLRLEDPSLVDLDIGDDDTTIEVGRDAPPARPMEEDMISDAGKLNDDVNLELDIGDDDAQSDKMNLDDDGLHDNLNDLGLDFDNDDGFGALTRAEESRFQRDSESPLSDAGSVRMHQLEEELNQEEHAAQHGQRVKRQKLMEMDKEPTMSSNVVKALQKDRSQILKPATFLPRDPVLLTLMTRQQNGDFVSSVFGEARGRGWAPELRGLLSLDSVKKAGELKRKRDSGISDMDVAADVPALELGDEEAIVAVDEGIGLDTILPQSEIEFPGDEENQELHMSEDDGMQQPLGEFDPAHPLDSGPVSMGTQHAVHILRERLGEPEQKKSVLFQDLLPEKRASKADATKMFFEVLVLATKDAVQAEQGSKSIGGPLKIRGKPALWGSWAEENADGAPASQLVQAL